jgi:hypothetical protein
MCFSLEASFAAGAVLVPAGVYCLQAAARKRPRWLPLAAVPLIFGLQQISEGFVWLGLRHDDRELTHTASLAFLFPALALWPFWIPFLAWCMENHPVRKRFFFGLTVFSTVWFLGFYVPLATGPATLLTTQVQHHSIAYEYAELGILHLVPRGLTELCYLLLVTVPLLVSNDTWPRCWAWAIVAAATVAFMLFEHAFVSVWCFFAAALAVYLVGLFRRVSLAPDALAD